MRAWEEKLREQVSGGIGGQ